MRKFASNRKLKDIVDIAVSKGFEVEESNSDWIYIKGSKGQFDKVAYNTCNGKFFVYSPELKATEMSEELEGQDWYDELLDIFYCDELADPFYQQYC